MAINTYRVHEAEEREICHYKYISDPNFRALESKARSLGFRHATISEIHAGADDRSSCNTDLYCWAGGLWVKLGEDVK